MNEHADKWMDAHLDGELSVLKRRQVEDHLAECDRCQKLLTERRSLSALLDQVPAASGLKPPEQFVIEVNRRVRPSQTPNHVQKALQWGWQFAPVALLLTWAFLQSVSILSNLLLFFPGVEAALQQGVEPALGLPWLSGDSLVGLGLDGLRLLGPFGLLDWGWVTSLVALASIGLLYLGWLGSWWARAGRVPGAQAA